jgi:uncharacterized membrane protein YjjP (DUF1212 family)
MKKSQRTLFIFPIIYFLLVTGGQVVSDETVRLGENLVTFIISSILLFLGIHLYNWARKPYQWGSRHK